MHGLYGTVIPEYESPHDTLYPEFYRITPNTVYKRPGSLPYGQHAQTLPSPNVQLSREINFHLIEKNRDFAILDPILIRTAIQYS